MTPSVNRSFSLDLLRVFACYLVIQVHAGEFFYIGEGGRVLGGENAFWVNLYNSIGRAAVPLFIMLTGYFLLPVKDSMDTFFKKRFTRVVIPFVIWCAVYAVYQLIMGQVDAATAGMNLLKIPLNFGTEAGHLWYIYMLIGLYLFAPIISPWLLSASKNNIQFYLTLWALTLCLPYIHLIFPEVWGECYWNPTPMLYYFSGFLGFGVLGYYLKTYHAQPEKKDIPIGIVFTALGYGITYFGFAHLLNTAEFVPELELTWSYGTINVGMMAVGLFFIFKNIRISSDSFITRLITDISLKSYGIYLLHIILLFFFHSQVSSKTTHAMIAIPVITIATFIASYIIIKLLSFLPKSKYIIG